MIADIFDTLVSQAASALGVTVVRAFPNWARPTLVPPLAALEIAGLLSDRSRIGQKSAQHVLGLRLYLFAETEPALAQMLDSVMALEQSILTLTVAGKDVNFAFGDGQRHQNQTGTQQEDHGFSFYVTASYTE